MKKYKDSQLAYWAEILERENGRDAIREEFPVVVRRVGVAKLVELALQYEESKP